jgi:hypothetical protein
VLADWNFRYVPVLQRLYYKNFSFYALAGDPGCISFELPEPIGNMWTKKSIWRRYDWTEFGIVLLTFISFNKIYFVLSLFLSLFYFYFSFSSLCLSSLPSI